MARMYLNSKKRAESKTDFNANRMEHFKACYAGIGASDITLRESYAIECVATHLAKNRMMLYSGHLPGAGYSFEIGAEVNHSVVFLPWKHFNGKVKCRTDQVAVTGEDRQSRSSVSMYHPNPKRLSKGAMSCMACHWNLVMGHGGYPPVSFVLCCATPTKGGHVVGSTGQAVRIAKDNDILVINIRHNSWERKLRWVYRHLGLDPTISKGFKESAV